MIRSAEEFVQLRKSKNREEYGRAASDCATHEIWLDIISKYPDMRKWVGHNKTVPVEILEVLVSDPDENVRIMVAMKRKLTPQILARLATDENESVRLRVARHRNTTDSILGSLATDPWSHIREVAMERLADNAG